MRFNLRTDVELITSDHKEELSPEARANHSRSASLLSLLSGAIQEFIYHRADVPAAPAKTPTTDSPKP